MRGEEPNTTDCPPVTFLLGTAHYWMVLIREGSFEGTREMCRAYPRYGAEIPYVDGAVQILVDESLKPRYLPARQPTRFPPVSASTTRVSDCRMIDALASDAFAAS
jgi:hypothetical protein